jgi:hypothetical protein
VWNENAREGVLNVIPADPALPARATVPAAADLAAVGVFRFRALDGVLTGALNRLGMV